MTTRDLFVLLLALSCAAASPTTASAWQVSIDGTANGDDRVAAVAADPAGDVIAAGALQDRSSGTDFLVVKRAGTDGRELWRAVLNGTANGDDRANAVAVDRAGDVVAAGVIRSAGPAFGDLAVVKLSGRTGVPVWRAQLNGTAGVFGEALAVAVDAAGDVVAVGDVTNLITGIDFIVVKLSGATGAVLWRREIDSAGSNDVAQAVAIDANGDVLAAGFVINPLTAADLAVVKLDGRTGREVWRSVVNGSANSADLALAIGVDRAGNAIAAGALQNGAPDAPRPDFAVLKFRATDGRELWRATLEGGGARAVAVDGDDDVVAAGVVANASQSSDFVVVKLGGATGAPLWQRVVNTAPGSQGGANAVSVSPAGVVAAAGFIIDGPTFFTVVALEGASGAERWRSLSTGGTGAFDEALAVAAYGDDRVAAAGTLRRRASGDDIVISGLRTQLAGRQLVVQDSAQDPSKRRIGALSQDAVLVAGTPGGPADPTVAGGTLVVANPATGERAEIALPSARWSATGSPTGYVYTDTSQAAGPCTSVVLRPGEALKANCSGRGIGFTLNEPSQGALDISLQTGTLTHCLSFGGRIVKDVPAIKNRIGEFQATSSPAPAACADHP
jgi:putative pyrroloquinoline-quinone binding quinoprotein